MKLVIKREPFLKAFNRAAIAAPARSNKPALTNVLLTASNGDSSLQATDMEIAIRVGLSAKEMDIEQGGKVLLPAALFGAMLKESADESLRLDLDAKHNLQVRGQRTGHKIGTAAVDEFPAVGSDNALQPVSIPAPMLSYALRSLHQIAGENTRYILNCVLVAVSEKSVSFVSTNGSVMGVVEHSAAGGEGGESLLPSNAAKSLSRALADEQGDVVAGVVGNWLHARIGDLLFTSRLAEGRFPRWRDVFPARQAITVYAPVGPLLAAVREATLTNLSEETGSAEISLADGQLVISSKSGVGESSAAIPVAYDGKPFSIWLNWRYLTACLNAFPPDCDVALKLDTPTSPMVIDRDNTAFVIMPHSPEG